MVGAEIVIYINGKKYNSAQSFSLNCDYGETPIFGIDSPFAQEITTNKVSVSGSISGIRIRNSSGIQSVSAVGLTKDIMSSPYISILIEDRQTQEQIVYLPRAKVTSESHSAAAKGTYKLNISFIAVLAEWASDRVS
jgi:hypothetical protein